MRAKPDWKPLQPAPTLKPWAVGQWVHALRQRLGRTQDQGAAMIGTGFSTLNRWGHRPIQSLPLVLKQVYNTLTQWIQPSISDLHDGSRVLLEKHLKTHDETASQQKTSHYESTLNA